MSSQRLSLDQKLLQKLSPQQIQFIKLLQLNTFELEQRIEEELLENPGLETNDEFEEPDKSPEIDENEVSQIEDDLKNTGNEEEKKADPMDETDESAEEDFEAGEDDLFDISDYLNDDGDEDGFHLYEEAEDPNEEHREMPIAVSSTFHENLAEQFEAIAHDLLSPG